MSKTNATVALATLIEIALFAGKFADYARRRPTRQDKNVWLDEIDNNDV